MARTNQDSTWNWLPGAQIGLNSIQVRLVLLAGLIYLVTWIVAAQISNIQGFRNTRSILEREVAETTDILLHASTNYLAYDHQVSPGRSLTVWEGNKILTQSRDHAHERPTVDKLYTRTIDDTSWIYAARCADTRCVVYGVSHLRRHQNLYCLVASIFGPIFLVLAAGFVALVLSIRYALSPLNRFASSVMALNLESPTPIKAEGQQKEFSPLVDAINNLSIRVGSMLQKERMFFGSCAHEIRTPIAGLLSQLQLVENRTDLEKVNQCAQRTAQVANQFLAFAASKSLYAAGGETEIFDICENIRKSIEPIANQNHSVQFEVTGLPFLLVEAHAFAVDTVIENLVQNCLKHAGTENQKLSIRVSIGAIAGRVQVSVEDNGVGLSRFERELALKQFRRLNEHRRATGSGLGLSIVHEISNQYGGQTDLKRSNSLGGLQVIVSLPIESRDQPITRRM